MTTTDVPMSDLKEAMLLLIKDSRDMKRRWEESQIKWAENQAKADAERKQQARELGDIARKQGLTAEYFVYPNIERILREVAHLSDDEPVAVSYRICKLNPDYQRNKPRNGVRQQIELDVVAESSTHVLINETKNDLRTEHVHHFLEVLQNIKRYAPEFANKTVLGCVSTYHISPDLLTYISRQGLIAVSLADGTMSVKNDEGTQFRTF